MRLTVDLGSRFECIVRVGQAVWPFDGADVFVVEFLLRQYEQLELVSTHLSRTLKCFTSIVIRTYRSGNNICRLLRQCRDERIVHLLELGKGGETARENEALDDRRGGGCTVSSNVCS